MCSVGCAVIVVILDDHHSVDCLVCVRWWIGEWQKCSASCGSSGQTKRTVLCIQAVSAEEQKALPSSECEQVPKPASLSSCNMHIPCPSDWTVGTWSKVSLDLYDEPFVSKFRFCLTSVFNGMFGISQCIEIWSTKIHFQICF